MKNKQILIELVQELTAYLTEKFKMSQESDDFLTFIDNMMKSDEFEDDIILKYQILNEKYDPDDFTELSKSDLDSIKEAVVDKIYKEKIISKS